MGWRVEGPGELTSEALNIGIKQVSIIGHQRGEQ